ncbi:MAG: hypothetical protein ACOC4B_02975, partial [Bacteroidota bacterium]
RSLIADYRAADGSGNPIAALEHYAHYYPGGFPQPGRSFNLGSYRYGHNGQESDAEISESWGSHYTGEYWMMDSRILRRWEPDPVVKFNESPYAIFSNNPIWIIDTIGADTAVFGSDNKFVEIKPGGDHIGQKLGDDGFFFNFVDPENDMKSIESGDINELYIAENKTILKDLDRAGVNKEENKGFIDGPLYLKNHSDAGLNSGELDFVIQSEIFGSYYLGDEKIAVGLPSNKLYITKVNDKMIAHNNYNFGNFMWGASANALDVSLWLTLLGAHINNYLNDINNNGKSWYKRDFDSKDDQLSITLGWYWRKSLKK